MKSSQRPWYYKPYSLLMKMNNQLMFWAEGASSDEDKDSTEDWGDKDEDWEGDWEEGDKDDAECEDGSAILAHPGLMGVLVVSILYCQTV